jgi:hypothetical protein
MSDIERVSKILRDCFARVNAPHWFGSSERRDLIEGITAALISIPPDPPPMTSATEASTRRQPPEDEAIALMEKTLKNIAEARFDGLDLRLVILTMQRKARDARAALAKAKSS